MTHYPLLPASTRSLLRRYRLDAREAIVPNLSGGQLMRRKGQSLEFRDFVTYVPGDDIRFVDWRASARRGSADDLVVRSYVAEEQLRLIVSVDTGPTMAFPELGSRPAMTKMLIARWLAEALARVALDAGDTVFIHQLFDRAQSPPYPVYHEQQLRAALAQLLPTTAQAPANIRRLLPALPPATVWLVITDSYFYAEPTPDIQALAATIAQAQAGLCWVLVIELDCWKYERGQLGTDVWQVPIGSGRDEIKIQFDKSDDEYLGAVEEQIKAAKSSFHQAARLSEIDVCPWAWPAHDPLNPELFFNTTFLNDRQIQRIFVKQTI